MSRPLLVTAAALALMLAGCGGDDSSGDGGRARPATGATAPARAPAGCRSVAVPAPKRDGGQSKPTAELDPARRHSITFATNCGAFTVSLNVKASPQTAASMVALVRSRFFDGTIFHRIVPGYVIQGGDPTGSGQGGPGYSTVDRPPRGTAYTRGVVAMAKAGQEAPGTAGSQFYVVTGQDAALPPDYALLGRVTKGLEVVERIGTLGEEAGTPTFPVVIERARASAR